MVWFFRFVRHRLFRPFASPVLRLKRDPITYVSLPSCVLIEYFLRIVQALGRVTYKWAGSRTRIEERIMDVVVASKGPELCLFPRGRLTTPLPACARRLGHLAGLLTVARPQVEAEASRRAHGPDSKLICWSPLPRRLLAAITTNTGPRPEPRGKSWHGSASNYGNDRINA
jgi:hypothetical protein